MLRYLFLILFLFTAAFFAGCIDRDDKFIPGAGGDEIEDPIEIAPGPITGEESDGVRSYKGIPYAAPPVGELRWKPPRPPEPWTQPVAMTSFGPSCPQHEDSGLGKIVDEMDEDCLYLNVWTPAQFESDALPVMFWIHGGGFILGSGTHENYSGEHLARDFNVVAVTINYRLGVFGFLAHPELSAEDADGVSGNYGLKDQVFALEWVRDNIRRFGGDPGNVTIFGESAGAASVCFLMASPMARGLFHRAIAQSGNTANKLRHLSQDTPEFDSEETLGIQFAENLGIYGVSGAVAQLRAKTWQELLDADDSSVVVPGGTLIKWVCVDGKVFTDTPYNIFKAGQQAPVPFITGTTQDEGSIFSSRIPINTIAMLRLLLIAAYGSTAADEILALYEVNTDADAARAYEEILGDSFVAGARRTTRMHTAAGNPAYLYQFTRSLTWMDLLGLGAFHGCEIVYVFGTLSPDNGYTGVDFDISSNVMGYWSRFAGTGDPNEGGLPAWPAYNAADDEHLIIDSAITVGTSLRKPYCDYFDSLLEP